MINLELYRIFYEVTLAKSITNASKKLNISQPAITKHIKNLESELNTILFIRTKKGVILTTEGEKLFLKVKNALIQIDEAEKELENNSIKHIGTVRIGISTTLVKVFLLEYIEKFHDIYPNITIEIDTDPMTSLTKKLHSGELDFIIGKLPSSLDKDLIFKTIIHTKYTFAYNPTHFKIKSKVSLRELAKYPIIIQKEPSSSNKSVKAYFKANNIELNPKMTIASSNLLALFIKIGYGIGYVTEYYIKSLINTGELKTINVTPIPPKINIGIIMLKNTTPSNSTQDFIDFIKQNTFN